MDIGKSIKKIREQRGLSQKQLADALFVSVQMVSGIECGIRQPSLNLALGMAKTLGVSVEELVGADNEKESER